jgi:hypothetical protein
MGCSGNTLSTIQTTLFIIHRAPQLGKSCTVCNLREQDAREATGVSIPNDFPLRERNIFI